MKIFKVLTKKCPGALKTIKDAPKGLVFTCEIAEPTIENLAYNISYIKKKKNNFLFFIIECEHNMSERLCVHAGTKVSCFPLPASACEKQFHDFIRVGFAAAEQLKLTGSLDSALL